MMTFVITSHLHRRIQCLRDVRCIKRLSHVYPPFQVFLPGGFCFLYSLEPRDSQTSGEMDPLDVLCLWPDATVSSAKPEEH